MPIHSHLRQCLLTVLTTVVGLPLLLAYLSRRSRRTRQASAFVTSLCFYPVKSCAGIEIDEAVCQPFGLEYNGVLDRSFCIYHNDGGIHRVITLKSHHALSLLVPRVDDDGKLWLTSPGMEKDFCLETDGECYAGKPRINVMKSRDAQTLVDCGDDASSWISSVVPLPGVRLGYLGSYLKERMTKIFSEQTLYGDQSLSRLTTPVHIVSRASLDDLSRRCGMRLPTCQLRQPVLVDGCQAYEEDTWRDVDIGESRLYSLMLAERCILITNNPGTGRPHDNQEPFRTLKTYRKVDGYTNGPVLGIKLGVHCGGRIRVGDAVSDDTVRLLQELCTVFKLDLPFRKRSAFYGVIKEVVNTKNMKTPTKASRLYICQYCLVHLGDIARYRQQIDQAQTDYRHAVYLVPYNGQPYNQLAILEASKGHKLASVFYYVRSLLVRNPFPVAAMNLEKFYNKIVREPLELKGKLSMNEIVMAFLQFHALVYLLQDLNKAEKLKDRLLTSLPAHITSMSFSSHQFIQIIVINLGAMYQATRNKENRDEFEQQRAHQLVMHLNVSLLESLISGTPKQRVREYHTLAAIKILFDWMRHCEGVVDDQTLAESTVWPGMCKLLNNLQYIAQQKNVKLSNTELEKTPLPEDYDVQCFQPLDGCYRKLDFSSPHPDSSSAETETRLRCERLVQHGVWLAEHLPTKLAAHKQKSGAYAFSTPVDQSAATIKNTNTNTAGKTNVGNKIATPTQSIPVKIMLNSEDEYPSLCEKRPGRQNVAIQSLLTKHVVSPTPVTTSGSEKPLPIPQSVGGGAPLPGSVFILPSQRATQRSPDSPAAVQSQSTPQMHPQSLVNPQSQVPVQSASAPDLKPPTGGILKVPSQDFDQQSGGNGQKPSVHFRIDSRSEVQSPERDSPQELLSQPGILKLPSRQIWMPDQPMVSDKRQARVTQAWNNPRMDSTTYQPTRPPGNERFGTDSIVAMPGIPPVARQLSPTQQAIARQMTPQGVARQHSPPQQQQQQQQQQQPLARQLSPQQLVMQMTSQQQMRPRQVAPQITTMAGQHFPGHMQQQQQQQQQHVARPPSQQDMSLVQQMALNRPPMQHPPPGNQFYLGNQQGDVRQPMNPFFRPQSGKHPLEGLGIQDPNWSSDRQFTSYVGNQNAANWDRMLANDSVARQQNPHLHDSRFPANFNLDSFLDPRLRNPMELGAPPRPFVNLDPRNIAMVTQGTSLVSGIQLPRMDGQDKQGYLGSDPGSAPPTPGGAPPTPGGAPSYSLFSQTPWSTSGHYDVTNVSPQKAAVAPSKGPGMYQQLWSSGPSPLEKLLEQQKQQRQHEPH